MKQTITYYFTVWNKTVFDLPNQGWGQLDGSRLPVVQSLQRSVPETDPEMGPRSIKHERNSWAMASRSGNNPITH